MTSVWEKTDEGHYHCRREHWLAIVVLTGELWGSHVYWNGVLVDCAEWDSRADALVNAFKAGKRAERLRDPCGDHRIIAACNEDDNQCRLIGEDDE